MRRQRTRGRTLLLFLVFTLHGLAEAPADGASRRARTLSIASFPEEPCTPGTAAAATPSVLSLRSVRLAGDEPMSLDAFEQPGWIHRDGELHQIAPCALPFEIEIASDWVGLELGQLRQAALVRFGTETKWLEPGPNASEPIHVELGTGAPAHGWKEPTWARRRQSLSLEPLVVGAADARRRVRIDEPYEVGPSVPLPAKTFALPVELELPDVLVPRDAVLRFGVAGADARVHTVRAELRAGPTHAKVVTAPTGGLTWLELSLADSEGVRGLRLSLASESADTGRVILVDPSLAGRFSAGPPRTRKPNVLLVTLDTVRADHLSLHGYERPTTPFLETVAPTFLVFDAAYSQVPSTRPSHYSIFSSRYPSDLGIWSNGDRPLPQSDLTLAEVLRSAGWRTGAVLSAAFLGQDGGARQGFDEFFLPAREAGQQLGEVTTDLALDFISRNADAPFFLWLHYFDAHLPYQTVPEYQDLFWKGPPPSEADIPRDLIEKEGFGTLEALPNRAYMTALYDASIRYLDSQIRALLTFLEERDLLEESVVVIAADHGEALGEHGVYFAHDGLYEPTVRVPLLLRLPDARRAGRSGAVVENLDIAPTILDAVGLEIPPQFRGSSLLAAKPGDGVAFFEHSGRWLTGMRRGNLKWIDASRFRGNDRFAASYLRVLHEGPDTELFDLDVDPEEQKNLADERPKEAEAFARSLRERESTSVPAAATRARPDPLLQKRLRELGYVE